MMERLWFVVHRYAGFWFLRLIHSNGKTKRSNPFNAFAADAKVDAISYLILSVTDSFLQQSKKYINIYLFFYFPSLSSI